MNSVCAVVRSGPVQSSVVQSGACGTARKSHNAVHISRHVHIVLEIAAIQPRSGKFAYVGVLRDHDDRLDD